MRERGQVRRLVVSLLSLRGERVDQLLLRQSGRRRVLTGGGAVGTSCTPSIGQRLAEHDERRHDREGEELPTMHDHRQDDARQ